MAFCQKCGTEASAAAAFCGSCGTSIAVKNVAPSQSPTTNIPSDKDVSESWKKRFSILEKAGGPKLQKVRELGFVERRKLFFNIWGFLFGPFYYLAKGMWKKAIILTALAIAAVVVLELVLEAMGVGSKITNFVAPAIFSTRANIDYYKKIVLDDNEWW